MRPIHTLSCFAILLVCGTSSAFAQVTLPAEFQTEFRDTIGPFLKKYCLECHNPQKAESMLSLSRFDSADAVARELGLWKHVLERIDSWEMPPEESLVQPSPEERTVVLKWIRNVRTDVARRNAGDPGLVPARRLSNSELDYTIRDLTGVDLRPARDFPVDPANEAGFDNSAESLAVTPALLNKYLDAMRSVADHIVFKPDGFDFAPYTMLADPDKDKYTVNRIIAFYNAQKTNLADYFHAAWEYKLAGSTGDLNAIAKQHGLSAGYLQQVWNLLENTPDAVGPIAKLQQSWRELPQSADESRQARLGCEKLRDWVLGLRARIAMDFQNPDFRGLHAGSQPLVLRLNQSYATHRRSADLSVLQVEGVERPANVAADADLAVAADEAVRARQIAEYERFASIFPDNFYVSERGRIFLKNRREREVKTESGRLLSAGYHSMMGYFRDDQPLSELLLDEAGREELNRLWRELDYITRAPIRQHQGFIWFERAEPPQFLLSSEFNHVRAEDQASVSEASLQNLKQLYLAKVIARGGNDIIQAAVNEHFTQINASLRQLEQMQRDSEPAHLRDLITFAARAWRRPLTSAEDAELLAMYRAQRSALADSHEDAIRDVVVSVLASPHFWYRVDETRPGSQPVRPLDQFSLASRLSYFLWSSQPDAELLSCAAAGTLDTPSVLLAQTRRMLQDARVRGLATEFGGNWLEVRRFEEHNSVDRERFPAFTNDLRRSMFEEPVRFLTDAFQNNRSTDDLLFGKHTFVNALLAQHYGIPVADLKADEWVRIDDATQWERGGLLPMSVFLTKNSPGLRTSPVKRGYWVVRRLLGQEIPPPPPNVPELPADESKLGELTLREALAAHRANASCAVCHEKFDSFGLVFEGFGPVGELRKIDLGGRPVQTVANFPDHTEGAGLEGLRTYLKQQRRSDFAENLSRKLLSYALGRSLLPSDDELVEQMRTALDENEQRLGSLIEVIVLSPQFRNKRVNPELAASPTATE